jgi:mannose-1-phosphate guanylyltransferase
MKAVILAGGLGTRLLPYTKTLPKPMLPLEKKPILEYVIKWIKKYGIKDIVLCASYKHEKIKEYFQDGKRFGVNIEYAISKKPLSTAGQLKTAEKFIDDAFVCVYGDSIFNHSLRLMISHHQNVKPLVTMCLFNYKYQVKYGVIKEIDGDVEAWEEKPIRTVKINTGCYIFESKIFSFIPKNKQYGMDTVIRKIISKREHISSITTNTPFIDIGDKEIYEKTKNDYKKKNRKK